MATFITGLVSPNTKVLDLKNDVSRDLKIPVWQQKLLIMGRPLSDEKCLHDYPEIQEGSKLVLFMTKENNDRPKLRYAVRRFLLKHLSPSVVDKVVDEYIKEFNKTMASLSLDDIERWAEYFLNEEANGQTEEAQSC